MRLYRSILLSLAPVLLPVAAFATPAVLQPPTSGSMYNGNNTTPPRLEAADKANYDTTDASNSPAGSPAQGNQAGAGAAKPQGSGAAGGNTSNNLRDASGGQPAAATGATLSSGAAGSTSRAGGGN